MATFNRFVRIRPRLLQGGIQVASEGVTVSWKRGLTRDRVGESRVKKEGKFRAADNAARVGGVAGREVCFFTSLPEVAHAALLNVTYELMSHRD